jgi:hypothetical protein
MDQPANGCVRRKVAAESKELAYEPVIRRSDQQVVLGECNGPAEAKDTAHGIRQPDHFFIQPAS